MLLCFLSVTFWQCQKEELYENLPTPQNKELKVQLLKGSDAQKIANRFKKEIHAFKNKSFGHEAGVASREENEFTIDYSQVLEVSDTLGNTNYTFRVSVNPEVGDRTLFNFVINNRENQNKTFLLEYEMSEAFSLDYFNKRKTFDQFQGLLKIINIGSEGSNPCEDVIVEFNPPEPGGNQGVTYPINPSENPSPTIPIAGTTGGHNIGVIIIGGTSGGGGGGGGGSNPGVSNGDNPGDGCDATLEEILDCISNNRTWDEENCVCHYSPRYFRFGNITVIENMPDPCDGVIGAVGVLEENKTPCDILKQQSIDNNKFKTKIDSLRQRVLPSTPNYDTSETIVTVKKLDGEYFYNVSNNASFSNGIYSATGTISQFAVARIHNHPENSLPIFAPYDIVEHFDSYNFVLDTRKNEFTDYLVSFNNTTYALRIENKEALNALFIGLDLNTAQGKKDALNKVFKIFESYGFKKVNNPPYTQAMAEELFMNVVNDPKMGGGNGINLYRKDADGWGKMVKNGNIISKVPCY